MAAILLKLESPMQSWGISSRYTERETETEPSKSGLIGIIASALGRKRDESCEDLNQLKMFVRVDREGKVLYDYHTTLDVVKANASAKSLKENALKKEDFSKTETVISRRFYVSDACFLVALESKNENLLKDILTALHKPQHPLFFGRKSFLPSSPIILEDKIILKNAMDILKEFKWQGAQSKRDKIPEKLRIVKEISKDEGIPKNDVPVSFEKREFSVRYVANEWISTDEICKEDNNPEVK